MAAQGSKSIKLVVVGDGAIGKTCLLISYAKGEFPTGYVPTVFDSYSVTVPISGEDYELGLYDTAGQEDYDRLRPMAYPGADIILVCFSVVMPDSIANLSQKWLPEIRQYCPNTPYLIVGTQSDRRTDSACLEELQRHRQRPVSIEQGEQLAKNERAAAKYLECSAKTGNGLVEVFQQAITTALAARDKPTKQKGKSGCCCL